MRTRSAARVMKNKRKGARYKQIKTIVYKGALTEDEQPVIIALGLPTSARSSDGDQTNKRRTSKAYTLAISPITTTIESIETGNEKNIAQIESGQLLETAYSWYDSTYEYHVGGRQVPRKPFNTNYSLTCASGIHFFFKAKDAVQYLTSDIMNSVSGADVVLGVSEFGIVAKRELARMVAGDI